MGRTATKVTNLKDISLDQLRTFEKNSTNKYSQNFFKNNYYELFRCTYL
ncbi:hypothetical protein [Clostridium pasteurianum]|nr:hypothetical protein [Clostridium pasteurianum]